MNIIPWRNKQSDSSESQGEQGCAPSNQLFKGFADWSPSLLSENDKKLTLNVEVIIAENYLTIKGQTRKKVPMSSGVT